MKPTFPLALILGLSSLAIAEDQPAAADPAPTWVNLTQAFTKQIGADEIEPFYLKKCIGMLVTPTGDIFIQTNAMGICKSADQGATWSVVEGNHVTGRWETGDDFSIAYPYDGRLAFFGIDGSGGISLDDGKTWRPFTKFMRMIEFADVDWSQHDPQTIFGLTHEPYFTVLSTDGGTSWRKTNESSEHGGKPGYSLGVIDGTKLVRASNHDGGVELSSDGAQTWTRVADFTVVGRRPVHYGSRVYWTTTKGVIVSSDGKDWALTGDGAANALYGPYFGTSEQEMMVVTAKSFLITADGGKTWQAAAPTFIAPDAGFKQRFDAFVSFGWDAKRKLLYASSLGASVFQLRLD